MNTPRCFVKFDLEHNLGQVLIDYARIESWRTAATGGTIVRTTSGDERIVAQTVDAVTDRVLDAARGPQR